IDEYQDVNFDQATIFNLLREKLGIIINVVGDPSQSIYMFRGSNSKYLLEFKAKTFVLTKNFRSHQSIVEFSKYLRPYDDYDVICTKNDNGLIPSIIFYPDEKILEEEIIEILTTAKNNWNIDLCNFAIISATRGRMCSGGRSHGL